MPSGTIIKVQGYEPIVIDHLLMTGIQETQIITRRAAMPKITYCRANGQIARYYPDIHIPHLNLIIEVKSNYYYERYLDNNLRIQEACLKAGYDFQFIIADKHLQPFSLDP